MRSYTHIDNHHKGLLNEQIEELKEIWWHLTLLLDNAIEILLQNEIAEYTPIKEINNKINKLVKEFDKKQIRRIQKETSKTRLSILYYGKIGDFQKIANNTVKLMEVFKDSFSLNQVKQHENSIWTAESN